MKIISYNVNGIRAAMKKGFVEWVAKVSPDILCLQETKAVPQQVETNFFEELGYDLYWMSANKAGYSGVAIFSRPKPKNVIYGCNMPLYDCEGRVLRADYSDFSLLNVYMPSGSSGDIRQSFKMKWLEDFQEYITELKKEVPNLIICGDYNICHKPIDIHDPIRNQHSSGFLPEEREWFSGFIDLGFTDTFRYFNQDPHHYSWWSYRAGARKNNKGWRIDYHLASNNLNERLRNAYIMPEAVHSDHCPVVLEID